MRNIEKTIQKPVGVQATLAGLIMTDEPHNHKAITPKIVLLFVR